jgi:uncharacterized protein
MSSELTGRGLTFPLQLGISGFAESTGAEKVSQSIRIILATLPGQRVMRPQFGCRLATLAFAPNTTATADLARYYVTDALTRWEPRIDLIGVEVSNDAARGVLALSIRYRLRATQDQHDLEYAFSLERGR